MGIVVVIMGGAIMVFIMNLCCCTAPGSCFSSKMSVIAGCVDLHLPVSLCAAGLDINHDFSESIQPSSSCPVCVVQVALGNNAFSEVTFMAWLDFDSNMVHRVPSIPK